MQRKVLINIVYLILTMLLVSLPLQASENLQIRIWTDKNEYLTREPISIHYRVENVGDQAVVMIFDALKGYFKIQDQHGQQYPNQLAATYGFVSDSLKPNESIEGSEDIEDRYGILGRGEYTCYLESPPWGNTPSAKSNELKIKVKDPTGDEKKALDMFLEAEGFSWCKEKDPRKWEQAFYKYLQLAEKYPKSVYAPVSLYTALLTAPVIVDKNIVISVCKKLIENFPNFYYIDDTFYNLIEISKILGDKASAMDYLKELVKKYPNTRTSKGAEYWLEKIEKQEFK